MAAPIRMVNQTCCGSLSGYGPQERLADQVLCHALCHRIAYNFPGKKILMAGKIQPAFPCGNVSDIGYPDLVRCGCHEFLIQQIPRHGQRMPGVRRSFELPLLPATQAKFPANPLDSVNQGSIEKKEHFLTGKPRPVGGELHFFYRVLIHQSPLQSAGRSGRIRAAR